MLLFYSFFLFFFLIAGSQENGNQDNIIFMQIQSKSLALQQLDSHSCRHDFNCIFNLMRRFKNELIVDTKSIVSLKEMSKITEGDICDLIWLKKTLMC